jgi:hypothetical protein
MLGLQNAFTVRVCLQTQAFPQQTKMMQSFYSMADTDRTGDESSLESLGCSELLNFTTSIGLCDDSQQVPSDFRFHFLS